MESARSIKDGRFPLKKKEGEKAVRMNVVTSALLVKLKEGTAHAPVSVCYRLVVLDPKVTGVASSLNKIAATWSAKLNTAPMLSVKENLEKLLAAYVCAPPPPSPPPPSNPPPFARSPDEGPEVPLAEVAVKGFDHSGKYNPAEHTDTDRAKKAEAEQLVHDWWMQRMNPKMGWTELLKEDKSRLDHGCNAYNMYDPESRCGKAMAHCYVSATPKQLAGYYADIRNNVSESSEFLDCAYTSKTVFKEWPIPIPTISNRESLFRSVWFKNDEDHSYIEVSYTLEDARKCVGKGNVRANGSEHESERGYLS
jgi:hypothetical protein